MYELIIEPMYPGGETQEEEQQRLLSDWQSLLTDEDYTEDDYDAMYAAGLIEER